MSDFDSDAAGDVEPPVSSPVRWIAATICIFYGFAKLNGSQFTVLDSELSKPLAQVSGFWLTWYYFSYSAAYGTLIALLQIAAGVLLVVPRTALLGALILLPIAANILLVDVFFGVDLGGTLAAAVLLGCVIAMISPYAPRLRRTLVLRTMPARPTRRALAGLGTVMASAFAFTWWVANYNNRAPTEIDGVWSVTAQAGTTATEPTWRTVFFERNRAELAVFRAVNGMDAAHDFEVENGRVRIWQTWLKRDSLIMDGRLLPDGSLQLGILPARGGGTLTLQRVRNGGLGAPECRSMPLFNCSAPKP